MPDQPDLLPLIDTLNDLTNLLTDTHTNGVVIGGVASSILGKPRMTHDVDVLILIDDSQRSLFLMHARNYKFEPRREDVLEFADRTRVLPLRHTPTEINVDVILGLLPFDKNQIIDHAQQLSLGNIQIRLPKTEDMIIMKAIAGRSQDLEDIRGILQANRDLDLDYVKKMVSEFATELDNSDIISNLEKLL